MTLNHSPTDNSGISALSPIASTALELIATDIPIVVFDATVGNGKQCGNLVGNASDDTDKWHRHVSADKAVIHGWLADFGPRATGIATSPGAVDAVVLDIDKPGHLPPPWWSLLSTAPFQSTDADDERRGHYWFDLPPGERFGNPAFDWGEIRCDGGGLILAPTPHARRSKGGRYKWMRIGETPTLPEAIAAVIRAKNNDHQGRVVVTDVDVEAFCQAHGGNERPNALRNLTNQIRKARSSTRNLVRDKLRIAAKEAKADLYPYRRAIDEIHKAAIDSYKARGETLDERDFAALVKNGIEQASKKTIEQCRDEANRNYGDHTDDYKGKTDRLNARINEGKHAAARTIEAKAETKAETNGRVTRENSNPDADAGENPNDDDSDDRQDGGRRATVCLADVAPTAVSWLWKGWLLLGKVSILEGESDVGKSTLTLSWASIVSKGSRWPTTVINGKSLVSAHDPAGVVLVGVEDANDDTVVPRLMAAGADLSRVHALNRPVDDDGKPRPFTVPTDIEWLRRAIVETDAKLVVIDPITACLPEDTRHGVDSSIRRILMCLVDLARETDSAIVLIRHFNKAQGMSAKNRGGGSVAYGALVRSVLSVGKVIEPQDNGATFAIARAIGNLSKPPESIGYRLDDAPDHAGLPKPEDDELRVSVVKWCGTVEIDADQLVGADGAKVGDARKTAPTRDAAKDAVADMLKRGPHRAADVITTVTQSELCSKGTVKAAAKELGVVKRSVYVGGKIDHWTWELPPQVFKMNATGAAT
jgi:hypothetical protein